MERIAKLASTMALAAALCMGATTAAFADNSAVTFENRGEVFSFTPGSNWTDTDLFDGFKGVMPGDVKTEEVTVTNGSSEIVKIYMHTEAHHSSGNVMSESVSAANEDDVEKMNAFLAMMDMKVELADGTVIYEASPDKTDGLTQNLLLGEFAPGESKRLAVTLTASTELGNEFANGVGEVDWVFTVEEVPEPLPDTGLSQTGDDMPVILLAGAALFAAAIALIAACFMRRSKQQ